MIIWIASYPKSGNTWMRAFLCTYLYTEDNKFNFNLLKKIEKFPHLKQLEGLIKNEDLKRDRLQICNFWIPAQQKLNLDKSIKFLKTHNACASYKSSWFTNEENTISYIYLVRDPRSVVCSFAHYSNLSIERSTEIILDEKACLDDKEEATTNIISSWRINYLSWKKKKKFDGIVIRYEDLLINPFFHFKQILIFLKKYIDIKIDEKKINECIRSCKFENLNRLEKESGFSESIKGNQFFRKGELNEWKDILDKNLKKKIEDAFKNEMKELGYI